MVRRKYTEEQLRHRKKVQAAYYARNRKQFLDRTEKSRLKRKYGMSFDDYWNKVGEQGSLCMICGEAETYKSARGKVVNLAVDHDHTTGRHRDLLCRRCNAVLGLVKDNITILGAMIAYIRRHKGGENRDGDED